MTTCLGKSCSFGSLCVSSVNIYPFLCVFLSLLALRVLISDHCFLFFLFTSLMQAE